MFIHVHLYQLKRDSGTEGLQREHAENWCENRRANRSAMEGKTSLLKPENCEVGDEVLVYREPKSKYDASWRPGVVRAKGQYAYTLEGGSKVAPKNIKKLKQPGTQNRDFAFTIGDLAVDISTRKLVTINDWDPVNKVYTVTEMAVTENFEVNMGQSYTQAGPTLTAVPGGSECKVGGSEWRMPRSVSAWLRKNHKHLVPP